MILDSNAVDVIALVALFVLIGIGVALVVAAISRWRR